MNLSIISQVLFYIAISVGITCASKMPFEGSTWPDTLLPFLVSLFLSIIGLIGWRMGNTKSQADTISTEDQTHPQKLLQQLDIEMNTLSTLHSQNRPVQELQSNVVIIIENYLIPISSQQQELYRNLGMERAAHILITLSFVQRILHRFQSALADDHQTEAYNCIVEALEGFLELQENRDTTPSS